MEQIQDRCEQACISPARRAPAKPAPTLARRVATTRPDAHRVHQPFNRTAPCSCFTAHVCGSCRRYIRYNIHATSYTWKHLGRLLDMSKTLADNGLPDESGDFYDLSIDRHEFVPEVQVYFNDDLTEF